MTYFGSVYAIGFVLGVVRTVWLEPQLGVLAAVVIEVPVILLASWLVAGFVVQRFAIVSLRCAGSVGILALALLWLAELAMSVSLGGSFSGFVDGLFAPASLVGFAAQLVFGAFPLLIVSGRR